jgi:hypothetical protein
VQQRISIKQMLEPCLVDRCSSRHVTSLDPYSPSRRPTRTQPACHTRQWPVLGTPPSPFLPAHARSGLKDAIGDAASSPATPSAILICHEDANDIFLDADDGADFAVAGDERLLAVDHDDAYLAVLLFKERTSVDAGAPVEEMEESMKAARSGCVRWIIKVVRAFLPFSPRSHPCKIFDLFH